MSDLIGRKHISNYIQAQINPYGKPFEGTTYELGLKIMEYIDNMESVYDVDKVVKELEEMLEQLSDCGDDWFTAEKINEAIEIVKGGGVNA